jgi:hypothetical protein
LEAAAAGEPDHADDRPGEGDRRQADEDSTAPQRLGTAASSEQRR